MAVQAQYPSNVLLLNSSNKNGQEGHDYSLLQPQQPPGAAELFDQPNHMIFNNGASSSRKRGRETKTTNASSSSPKVIIRFPFQSQSQSHLHLPVDLTQIQNQQQQNVVSTGLRLSFGDQQQQHRLQFHQQQQYQNPQQLSSSVFSSLLTDGMASQIKQQRDELTLFLQAQGEQLRRGLAEKRQRHFQELLATAEESVLRRLREKEAEVAKATRRNAELEARAAQLSLEAQAWQAKAKAQEAMAVSLQAQLHHAIVSGQENGALSRAEDAESACADLGRVLVPGHKCRGCGNRVATVVVLPCRHLCFCAECDPYFRACPVCFTVKNSTVEVHLS